MIQLSDQHAEAKYRTLFELSPIPTREEDFSQIKQYLDDKTESLDMTSALEFKEYLTNNQPVLDHTIELFQITNINDATKKFSKVLTSNELTRLVRDEIRLETYDLFIDILVNLYFLRKRFFKLELPTSLYKGRNIHMLLNWAVPDAYTDDLSTVIVTSVDLTELKKTQIDYELMEKRLQNSEAKLRLVLSSNSDFAKVKGQPKIQEVSLFMNDGRLIHTYINQNGRLVHNLSVDKNTLFVASLMIINNFVQEASRSPNPFYEMKSEGMTLAYETGKYISACVVTNSADSDLRIALQFLVTDVEIKYRDKLENWDGNLEKFQFENSLKLLQNFL
ncbi:MAG: hypothetical protein IH840_07445 [Candidatus Heimdallarchaeota archaeon]|nr:hypothetical protein [Candidatus Heimdallarchaeota archaeon]